MTKESAPQARKTELDEIWAMVMKLRASTTENVSEAEILLGIAELKSQIDENLNQVNVCLGAFTKDDSSDPSGDGISKQLQS